MVGRRKILWIKASALLKDGLAEHQVLKDFQVVMYLDD
jgi:hypothetical protein